MFANASQIVSGDLVEVSGNTIGTVSNIALTPSGQAQLTLNITNHAYDPLRQGTQATIRELSLSGIASRYVDLHLGAGRPAATIHADGVIPTADTTSEVDLDEIFNTLNGPTLKGLQDVFQGSASQVKGAGPEDAGGLPVPQPGGRRVQRPVPRAQPQHRRLHQLHHQDRQPRLRRRHAQL